MTETLEKYLSSSCRELSGVGPKLQERLQQVGLATVMDLLLHFPSRYQDRTRLTPLNEAKESQYIVAQGTIVKAYIVPSQKPMLTVLVEDDIGAKLKLLFFHFNKAQRQQLQVGAQIRVSGETSQALPLTIVHPEYRVLMADETIPLDGCLTPVYPSTEGVTQNTLRRIIHQAINHAMDIDDIPEVLPQSILAQFKLPSFIHACCAIHRPTKDIDPNLFQNFQHPAQQRLIIEELFSQQLLMQQKRQLIQHKNSRSMNPPGDLVKTFLAQLPFQLTKAQHQAWQQLQVDLQRAIPMLRLIQGDVGSGKTIVALLAMLLSVENGCQAILMAPTEVLAEQHYQNIQALLQDTDIPITLLTGRLNPAAKQLALEQCASQTAGVIIGTHALFQQQVKYSNIGMIVIDEQHRFGVEQRNTLFEKSTANGNYPHQLVMTATPIPRTLAQTVYADLDVTTINELPKGRQPITTVVMAEDKRQAIIERIRETHAQGRQCYWICPLIDSSEKLEVQAVNETVLQLQHALPELRITSITGRMLSSEKQAIMNAFQQGEYDLLVATTVIEVGIDVPNATLIIIENSERLGLAQLHQLRGRVGRGNQASYCILMYKPPLTDIGKERLKVMRASQDGFEIAQHDLKLRGTGELLGNRQTGYCNLRIADLLRDEAFIPIIRETLNCSEHIFPPQQIQMMIKRWS